MARCGSHIFMLVNQFHRGVHLLTLFHSTLPKLYSNLPTARPNFLRIPSSTNMGKLVNTTRSDIQIDIFNDLRSTDFSSTTGPPRWSLGSEITRSDKRHLRLYSLWLESILGGLGHTIPGEPDHPIKSRTTALHC